MNNNSNFVNESRNAVWLSGYVRGGDANVIMLHQSSNEDRAIPIHVTGRQRLPRANTPVEIKCHATGYRGTDGQCWVRLDAIQIKRASVTSAPRRLVALNALRGKTALSSDDFSPFASLEVLKKEIRENLRLEDQVVDSLLEDASKRTSQRDGFENKAILSGFVGVKAYMPPKDDGSHELGYIRVNLMQQADPERALHIRVNGADARYSKELKSLHPIAVIAQVRTHVVRDGEGNIAERHVYLATDRNNIGFATINDFSKKAFPAWWTPMVTAHYAERRRAAAQGSQPAAPQVTAPAPTQQHNGAAPIGVAETADRY